jgi:hypothetical protein
MKQAGLFLAGFASGWAVRSTVDSSRDLVVGLVAVVYGTVDRVKRLVAIEREHLEDLVAEGRARYESGNAAARAAGKSPNRSTDAATASEGLRAVEVPRRGRAA